MDTTRTPTPTASGIDDLFKLVLTDGLPAKSDGKELRYRVVRLRETGVGHERIARQQAERVVMIKGAPQLLLSDTEFNFALTVQHIAAFECDGDKIHAAMLDAELIDKLTPHDFSLIEERVFLITLAGELRYGNISQEDFDNYVAGKASKEEGTAPQHGGQAPGLGANAAAPESGPAMLADFTGSNAASAPALVRG